LKASSAEASCIGASAGHDSRFKRQIIEILAICVVTRRKPLPSLAPLAQNHFGVGS
jgi:hypothetical protein